MKKNWLSICLLLALSWIFFPSDLIAAQKWTLLSDGTTSQPSIIRSVATHQNALYAVATGVGSVNNQPMRYDGSQWTIIQRPPGVLWVASLTEGRFFTYNNDFYFAAHILADSRIRLYRFTNDTEMTEVASAVMAAPGVIPIEIALAGDDLIVSQQNLHFTRFHMSSSPITTDTIDASGLPSILTGSLFGMGVYNNLAHIAHFQFGTNILHMYRLNADASWTHVSSFTETVNVLTNPTNSIRITEYNNTLHLSYKKLYTSTDTVAPYTLTESEPLSSLNINHLFFGRLHVLNTLGQTALFDSTLNQWSFSNNGPVGYATNVVQSHASTNDRAYLSNFNLWEMARGIHSIFVNSVPFTSVIAGQDNVVAWTATIQVNVDDTLQLTVENLGTALNNRDIGQVDLLRENPTLGITSQVVATFNADATNTKRWIMPSAVPVADDDVLSVAMDVNDSAQPGTTISLAVQPAGFQTSFNHPDLQLGAPLAAPEITILENPNNPINTSLTNAHAYPQPAQNEINFLYRLNATSDVRIKIYDREGTLVKEIFEPSRSSGSQVVSTWHTTSVPSGVYFAYFEIFPEGEAKRTFTKRVYIGK